MKRIKEVIKVSIIGVITNICLVIFKSIIGFISGSISILMDALNNLSDILSSVITLFGMLLSKKKPDKEHPYGHGMIEYFSSLSIAIIIFITGIASFYESFLKILHPITVEYNITMLIIIIIGIISKLILGKYTKEKGRILNSSSLVASGSDALFDSIISLSTLIGAILVYIFDINIDGYLGVVISIFIIKAGISIIIESFNNITGTIIDSKLLKNIEQTINSYDKVLGSYDLLLHQYGPSKILGSIHIEVDDNLSAKEIHALSRTISNDILDKYGVILTIGIYATNTDDTKYIKIKNYIKKLIKNYKSIINFHGYYVDNDKMYISFDLIFDFKDQNIMKTKEEVIAKLKKKYPEYEYNIVIDTDFNN